MPNDTNRCSPLAGYIQDKRYVGASARLLHTSLPHNTNCLVWLWLVL